MHLPAIAAFLLAVSLLVAGRVTFNNNQTKFFIALLGLMAYHIPFATNNFLAFQVAKGMFATFVVYLAIITYVDNLQRFKTLIHVWLMIHVFLAITGMVKEGKGVGGFLGDENDFCMTLNMIIPIAFFLALHEKSPFKKLLYVGLVILFLSTNIITLSRGGFIGLAAVGLYCWLKSPGKVISALMIALLLLFVVQYAPDQYWEEISSIEEAAGSYNKVERIYLWQLAWNMFLDYPVLGVGQGNYPSNIRSYETFIEPFEGIGERSRSGMVAHSIYFTVMAELGLVGVFIFLALLFYIHKDLNDIYHLKSRTRVWNREYSLIFHLGLAMKISLIGFLVSGIFISILYYPNFWILMAFIVSLRRIVQQIDENCITAH
jgi:probable O-glycosylation ligase (exosortase A-associated)